jgi:chemotaxis protein methyltransferase CheR
MTANLENIIHLLNQARGIDLSKYDESFLIKSFEKRMEATQTDSKEDYCALLENDPNEAGRLLGSLNINYSVFFRNPLTFSVLESIVLPDLIQKRRNSKRSEIRVWSAACAGGQEAYSIAILLEELAGIDNDKHKYRIFATDCCESQLQEAGKGQYTVAALNNLSLKRLNQWFTRLGDIYIIDPGLKEHIDFSLFDLCAGQLACPPASIFGDFDIVFCSNLLFYYKPDYCKIILAKAGGCLANDGYMVTGEVERGIIIKYHYREVYPYSAIFRPYGPQEANG